MSTLIDPLLRRERLIVCLAIVIVFALASLYTVLGIGMPMSAVEMTQMADRPPMSDMSMSSGMMPMAPSVWTLGYGVLIFGMWWVMMIAMMTPSAAPTILLYTQLSRKTAAGAAPALSFVFLLGYLVMWAIFSVVATGLQWQLELRNLVSPSMMRLTGDVLAGSVLIAAGAYQFTALKENCLKHCRSPMQFIVDRRKPGLGGAFIMGLEHGAYCVGCCWFLMALLFVGGIMNLYWIAAIALYVALEKLTPFGGWVAKLAGAGLLVAGLWMIGRTFL